MSDLITKSMKHNIWAKIGLIFILSVLLMIPISRIKSIISERQQFEYKAKREVANKWANDQIAGAVVLSIPVVKKKSDETEFIHFLPKNLKIHADTKSMVRYRGLYKVPLYETKISMSGNFSGVSPRALGSVDGAVNWKKAVLSLGIQDIRGLQSISMMWNEAIIKSEVGEMPSLLMNSSVNGTIISSSQLESKGGGAFNIEASIRGTEELSFYPLGQITIVNMSSNWGAPSFIGSFLPENREIKVDQFQAKWKVMGMTRSIPKYWQGNDIHALANIKESQFGVSLLLPLQNYQLNTRSVKYSLMFVLLTFTTIFFIEIIYKIRFHPIHYVMVGGSLVLFYLLLLSFSEHLGFSWAYTIATGCTLMAISLFVLGVTKIKRSAGIVFVQLGILYGFLFALLQQEDFTLVAGASGLWFILVILMYITRKIDWFNLSFSESSEKD